MSNGNAFAVTTDMSGGLELKPGQKRRVAFNVQNISGQVLEGRARIQADMPAQESWYTIEGRTEKRFDVDEVHQYTVEIEIPPDTQEGRYAFQLQCAWVERPEERFGSSVKILVVVKGDDDTPNGGIPWWVWLVVAGVVLVVGGGVTWYLLSRPDVEVPNVVDLPQDSAIAVLNGLELVPVTTSRPAIGQEGIVLEQVPDSGQMVDEGATVDLIVAQRAALMPDLEGDRWVSAMGQISALQLPVSLQTTRQGARDSSVHAQFPSAGDTITVGDSISVTFTVPGPQIIFPDTMIILQPEIWKNLRRMEETGVEFDFHQLPGVTGLVNPNP